MTTDTKKTAQPQPKTRVGLFCRHADIEIFATAREEFVAAKEAGLITSENPIYKWITSEATIKAMSELQPGDSMTKEELVGFDVFGENADKVKTVLNKKVQTANFVNRQTVAAYVASVSTPGYRDLEEDAQEKAKAIALAWVDANVDDHGIFTSKKGRGGGITLRVNLEV